MDSPERLDGDERAILAAFARSIHSGGAGRLTIADLLPAEPKLRYQRQLAIWRLSDRGWLVVTSSRSPQDQHECSLTEDGLRQAMALEPEAK